MRTVLHLDAGRPVLFGEPTVSALLRKRILVDVPDGQIPATIVGAVVRPEGLDLMVEVDDVIDFLTVVASITSEEVGSDA